MIVLPRLCIHYIGSQKVICICHQCIHLNAPEYLKRLLQKLNSRTLRNSIKCEMGLIIPFKRCKPFDDRSLRTFGPRVWNPLTYEITSQIDFDKFKKQVKTYLFIKYFSVLIHN